MKKTVTFNSEEVGLVKGCLNTVKNQHEDQKTCNQLQTIVNKIEDTEFENGKLEGDYL